MRHLHLSCIDQQAHLRKFGRILLVFEFDKAKCRDTAAHALRVGLAGLLTQFPYLAGEIAPADPTDNHIRVSYPGTGCYKGHAGRIFDTSNAFTDDAKLDFKTLQANNFLPEAFAAERFCPKALFDHPGLDEGDRYATESTSLSKGISLPVLATKATFIPGGLVLSVWIYHAIADGTGWGRIFEVWAANVKSFSPGVGSYPYCAENQTIPRPLHDQDPSEPRVALDTLARTSMSQEETTFPPVSASALRTTPYKVIADMLRIPTSRISALKTRLSSEIGTSISNFIALASLLASTINEVRRPLLTSQDNTHPILAIVVNLRKYLGTQFTDPEFIGNCMLSAKASYHLTSSSTSTFNSAPDNLASFAKALSTSLSHISPSWISTRVSSILSNPLVLDNSELTFANGPDMYITSWQHMGADIEWGIPGTKEGKADAIRRAAWAGEGGIVVLPMRKGGGVFEVLVGLAEDDMAGLVGRLRDGGWLEGYGNECSPP
ncbi:hypothetical protein NX059_009931 [Plenodomus lindquistii]|nr:hypothetical protein NX059_009931 [Plenodomus lindquistii]